MERIKCFKFFELFLWLFGFSLGGFCGQLGEYEEAEDWMNEEAEEFRDLGEDLWGFWNLVEEVWDWRYFESGKWRKNNRDGAGVWFSCWKSLQVAVDDYKKLAFSVSKNNNRWQFKSMEIHLKFTNSPSPQTHKLSTSLPIINSFNPQTLINPSPFHHLHPNQSITTSSLAP
jgi:hypothetical protein